MDKLLALKMFVETIDNKGFSAAARHLGLATSSVSRLVDALEAELGAALLNRSTRMMTLTEAGAEYYLKAKQMIEFLAEADAQIMDKGDEPSGHLRISVPATFGHLRVAPHIGKLIAKYPKLELDMTLSDEIVDLLSDRFDLAIRLGSATGAEEVISRHVGDFRRWVVASPAYLATHGIPQVPQDLLNHQCLRFNYGCGQMHWTFLCDGKEIRIPIRGRLRSNNVEAILEFVLNDVGLALLPDWLVDDDIAAGRLTKVFDLYEVNPNSASSAITVLYLPNHRGSKRVNAFIDFLIQVIAETCPH